MRAKLSIECIILIIIKTIIMGIKNLYNMFPATLHENQICRCNNCDNFYWEELGSIRDESHLILLTESDEDGEEQYKGCPVCKTDGYLSDIEPFFLTITVKGFPEFTDLIEHVFIGERSMENIGKQIKAIFGFDLTGYENSTIEVYTWNTKELAKEAYRDGHCTKPDFQMESADFFSYISERDL
jgi:hypothetical protein